MNVRELLKALEGEPGDLQVVTLGHFGEPDQSPDYAEVREIEGKHYFVLGGLAASYPEPD